MKAGGASLPESWRPVVGRWRNLAGRDRRLLGLALVVLLLAGLWWVVLAPAIDVLRNGQARHRALDAELTMMRKLAQEAGSLQAMPTGSADDSLKALELSVRETLGATAQLNMVGDRATVILKGTAPGDLAEWLAEVRTEAKALPAEVHLSRNAAANGWDGTVLLALPPQR